MWRGRAFLSYRWSWIWSNEKYWRRLCRFYARTLAACLAAPAIVMAVSVLLSAAAYGLFVTLPQELIDRAKPENITQ